MVKDFRFPCCLPVNQKAKAEDLSDLWEDNEDASPVLLEVDNLGVRFGTNAPDLED